MKNIDKILTLVVPTLGVWLAALILKERLHRRFPFFFTYVLSLVLIGIVRFSVISHYRTYFFVFWITEAVYAILALLALFEVFRKVFLGFYLRSAWFRALLPSTAILAIAIVAWAILRNPVAGAGRLISFVVFFGLAVNFMQLCLFGLFGLLSAAFPLRWRFAPLGILLGFGIAALGGAAAFWARSVFGTKLETFAKYAPPVAYILATLVWLATFLRPEPEPKWVSATTLRELLEGIQQDTIAMKKFLDKTK